MSLSFPLPGSAPSPGYPSLEAIPRTPYYTELPGTGEEARLRADRMFGTGATGKSQPVVSVPITMLKFGEEYSYVKEAQDGQYVFHVRQTGQHGDEVAVITVDSLNDLLRREWQRGIRALTASSTPDEGYSQAEIQQLLTTPTASWPYLDSVLLRLNTKKRDTDLDIAYLCPELFSPYFLPFGWIRGMGPEFQYSPQKTVRVGGSLESVENIWGNNILTGDRLFLILKRTFDEVKQEWGHYAFHPWAGRQSDPSWSDVVYPDITGVTRTGLTLYLGTVDTWMEHVEIRDDLLPSYLNIERGKYLDAQQRQPSCLRITANGRPRGFPWLSY